MSEAVSDIADALRNRADELARKLLPAGRFEGRDWKVTGSNNPTGGAISVVVSGPKKGVVGFWNGAKKGGDILDLIGEVQGLSKAGAIDWAKSYLGLGKGKPPSLRARTQRTARRAERANEDNVDRLRRMSIAENVWRSAGPLSGAAAQYLRSRGIDPAMADDEIRAHCGLPHPEGGVFPALVARVTAPDGSFAGVLRIFVKADGSGKAPVENPKLGLGSSAGGAVRIGGIAEEVGAAEGLETGLWSRQLIYREIGILMPVWITPSSGGLRAFIPPAGIKSVRIFADGDPIKFRKGKILPSPGIEAAKALESKLQSIGVRGLCEIPPAPFDWADVGERINP